VSDVLEWDLSFPSFMASVWASVTIFEFLHSRPVFYLVIPKASSFLHFSEIQQAILVSELYLHGDFNACSRD
jgi:hypothetical protein